jgi:ABC-2 type transport system permease protein
MTTIQSLDHVAARYGARQALPAELSKLRSLRSTTFMLLATVVCSLAVTALATANIHRQGPGEVNFDPTNQSLSGLALGSLLIGVIGVLAISGEYSSGTIRSTLAATPRRPLLLGAKVAVVGALTLVVSEALAFACFFVGQAFMSGHAPTATIGEPGVLRALVLTGAFLALLGLFGLGLGTIIRHTAGAICTYAGVIFILPLLLQTLNADGNPARFTPELILSNSVATVIPQSGQLSSTVGFLLMVVYCAVVLGIAAVLLSARDA